MKNPRRKQRNRSQEKENEGRIFRRDDLRNRERRRSKKQTLDHAGGQEGEAEMKCRNSFQKDS